ncbi:IS66 family transposase zinc-finger binding domain-containing protein [Bradyrhizobium yuanmingense]|uniref:IS66 family transposase zinc-finger binding domain-containing protein n=1 Tax=Bradyrhizobium yuanmingense TaxID=108015 RepID=UPI0021A53D34|nr:IS66 family transposase zinc-finger binding domain-containing protein [Bradyrhizobium sp. CB1024]UWU83123.1 IS66 family transposase zinc-finger binding domain-containing protein [Bradyrhizobium sp. CB1024]
MLIEQLKLTIKKLRHEQFGQSPGEARCWTSSSYSSPTRRSTRRKARRRRSWQPSDCVPSFERREPGAGRCRSICCGSSSSSRCLRPADAAATADCAKIGKDLTDTLELAPRRWKVIQHVPEKLACRACEAITPPSAPSHPIGRERAGSKLLAHVLLAKYGLHLPIHRESDVA